LIRCKEIPLAHETLEVSHRDENIIDPHLFAHTLEEALQAMSGKISSIGLSLPNDCLKITTHTFKGLHDKKGKIKDLIAWKEKMTLPYPIEKAKISFFPFKPKSLEERIFLVVIGLEDIIKDFEMNLKRLKINPQVVLPSMINHINFYMEPLNPTGITAFLGLFEQYFFFFVFEDDQMLFYRGKRKSLSFLHFVQEIDMTIELFHRDHPEKKIEKLYIGSQIELAVALETELENYSDIDITLINENKIITLDQELNNGEKISLRRYGSAIGAAQSLAN
jgi:hypothetical protein